MPRNLIFVLTCHRHRLLDLTELSYRMGPWAAYTNPRRKENKLPLLHSPLAVSSESLRDACGCQFAGVHAVPSQG
jgi:hypothetical protein